MVRASRDGEERREEERRGIVRHRIIKVAKVEDPRAMIAVLVVDLASFFSLLLLCV